MHICLPSNLTWIFWFYHDGCLYVRLIASPKSNFEIIPKVIYYFVFKEYDSLLLSIFEKKNWLHQHQFMEVLSSSQNDNFLYY